MRGRAEIEAGFGGFRLNLRQGQRLGMGSPGDSWPVEAFDFLLKIKFEELSLET